MFECRPVLDIQIYYSCALASGILSRLPWSPLQLLPSFILGYRRPTQKSATRRHDLVNPQKKAKRKQNGDRTVFAVFDSVETDSHLA